MFSSVLQCEYSAVPAHSVKVVATDRSLYFCLKNNLLRRANVTILGRGLCHEIYPEFTTRMMCAGRHPVGGIDACHVSSGLPNTD
jgi:hypothetical protein